MAKPVVTIAYCTQCNWLLRSGWMAQELLSTFGTELGGVTLVPGIGGVFEVRVDGAVVWERRRDGGFPDVKALKQRVRDVVSPERDLGHVDRASNAPRDKSIMLVAHCDWSTGAAKRRMCVATRNEGRWIMGVPEPVGSPGRLFDQLRERAQGPLLVGFDFPIGLPVAYAGRTGLGSFEEALRQFGRGRWRDWYSVCEAPAQISIERPFFPAQPGGTSRAQLFAGLGVASTLDLLRECDRATADRRAASPIFWTLGGQQVGKATIAGWRDMIVPSLDSIALWPFAGALRDLLGRRDVVVAETYPGEAYRHLGIPKALAWSKTTPEGRRAAGRYITDWLRERPIAPAQALLEALGAGFADDDEFDSVVGLCSMLDVVDGRRDDGAPQYESVRRWEGWILGQVAADRAAGSLRETQKN